MMVHKSDDMANDNATLAECPDCGSWYVWHAAEHVFRCAGCAPMVVHSLAPSDIYLEHDEVWTTRPDPTGRDAFVVLAIVTIPTDGDE